MSEAHVNPDVPGKAIPESQEKQSSGVSDALISELTAVVPDDPAAERDFPEPAVGETMISFSHVSMSFGDRKILDDVSFSVNRGQTPGGG